MKTLYIREGSQTPFEIIIVDAEGQHSNPIRLNDIQLLDLNANMSAHVRAAWQRQRTQNNTQ